MQKIYMGLMKKSLKNLALFIASIVLCSCGVIGNKELRVGVDPTYPPIIFEEGGKIKGIEADFAVLLANELGKDFKFVKMPFDDLSDALNDAEIDIVMSGMSITMDRSFKVNFLPAYMGISQMLIIREEDKEQYGEVGSDNFVRPSFTVGVMPGTTGEALAKKFLSKNKKIIFANALEGHKALLNKEVNCFIDDSPSALRASAINDKLRSLKWTAEDESLGWAVSFKEVRFHREVWNTFLKLKKQGKLDEVIKKWLSQN